MHRSTRPAQTYSAADAGITSVIWVSVSNLIALGIGAWIAARSASNPDYHSGTLQGVAVWTVASIVVLILATSSISGAAGSLMRTAGNVAGASGEAVADNMSEGDLEVQARRIQAQAQAAAGRANEALDRNSGAVREVAEKAAAVTAAGAFGLFLSMLSGLIAAIVGAKLGARHPVWDTRPRHIGSPYRNDRNDRNEDDRTERHGTKE